MKNRWIQYAYVVFFSAILGVGCAKGYAGDGEEPPPEEQPESIPSMIVVAGVSDTYTAGSMIRPLCHIEDQFGETMDGAHGIAPRVRIEPSSLIEQDGHEYRAQFVGTGSVTCTLAAYGLISEPVSFDIVPGDPYRTIATTDTDEVRAGATIHTSCDAYDAFGNQITDEAVLDGLKIRLDPQGAGITQDGKSFRSTTSGLYDVYCDTIDVAQEEGDVVRVNPGLPYSIAVGLNPNRSKYRIGDHTVLGTDVRDKYGNRVTGATIDYGASSASIDQHNSGYVFGKDGYFTLSAMVTSELDPDVNDVSGSVDVLVDSAGPSIRCMDAGGNQPANAFYIDGTLGVPHTISVEIHDDTFDIASVQINGATAAHTGGDTWEAAATPQWGQNFIRVVASDEHGEQNTHYCFALASSRWLTNGDYYDGSVSLALGQPALGPDTGGSTLDSISAVLNAVLGSQAFKDMIDATLAAQDFYKKGSTRIYYREGSLHYTDPNVNLAAAGQGLFLQLTLHNFEGKVTGKKHFFWPIGTVSATAKVTVERLRAEANVDVWAAGGLLHAHMHDTDISLHKPKIHLGGILGKLVSFLANLALPLFENKIEEALSGAAQDAIQDPLENLVTSLDIDSIAPQFQIPKLGTGGGSVTLEFHKRFTDVAVVDHNRIIFGMGTAFNALSPVMVSGVPGVPLRSQNGLLNEPLQNGRPIALAIQEALINQVLYALWKAGYFDIDFDLGGSGTASIDAQLPPVAHFEDGQLVLALGGVNAVVAIPPYLSDPPFDLQFGGRLRANAYLEDGRLKVGNIDFDPAQDLALNLPGSVSSATRDVLQSVIGDILLDVLTSAIDDAMPDLPIPSFTIPPDFVSYLGGGIQGTVSLDNPQLAFEDEYLVLRGALGIK